MIYAKRVELKGKINASQIASLKFATSGKIASINCQVGQTVKKGQLLATLEKTELQAYLDRALTQYDIERAEFDEKQKRELSEYDKRKTQDSLDISVKNVEIAKINLDAASLYSSINGIIAEVGSFFPGDNITPAGFVITVVNPESYYFEVKLPEEGITKIAKDQKCKISLKALPGKVLEGKVEQISLIPDKEGDYPVFISLSSSVPDSLRVGLTGTTSIL